MATEDWKKVTCILHKDAYAVYCRARALIEQELGCAHKNEPVRNGIAVEMLCAEFLAGVQQLLTRETMSHYSYIRKQLTDKDYLIKALQRLGFQPVVHETAQRLEGYKGDKRKQTAHIIVPRAQIGSASNDLGFYWNGTEYDVIISDYDRGCGNCAPRQGLGTMFLSKLSANYAVAAVQDQYGMEFEVSEYRTHLNGEVTFTLEVKEQAVVSVM